MSSPAQARTLLIVDDDRFLLDMYSLKFREQGFTVEVSNGGDDALKKLRGGLAPDIILLDIVMPGIDGFGVLQAIKKDTLGKNSTIVVLSNQGQDSDIARAKELGAEGYIVKASTIPSEVVAKVLEALRTHRTPGATAVPKS